ncbi:MAG: hypothetical protein O3A01_03090 [bacterium]|nr:hypothetical protein [bacterium]
MVGGHTGGVGQNNGASHTQHSAAAQQHSAKSAEAFAAAFSGVVNDIERDKKRVKRGQRSDGDLQSNKEKLAVEDGAGMNEEEEGVPLHQAIAALQGHLNTVSRANRKLARELKDLAQERIDVLKEDGYDIDDLELSDD